MANFADVLKELKRERSRLDQAIKVLGKLVGRSIANVVSIGRKPRPKMSAAARRRIAAAQRARWAKVRAGNSVEDRPRKRVLSIAARRKIAVAQRARWAKVKQERKA